LALPTLRFGPYTLNAQAPTLQAYPSNATDIGVKAFERQTSTRQKLDPVIREQLIDDRWRIGLKPRARIKEKS